MLHGHRLLATVVTSLWLGAPVLADDLKVGDQAPDFSLPGSDGKTYSLADLKGKTVVLAWFPKAFTGG
jgi:thioredoxin-dependent peroxiredoxin